MSTFVIHPIWPVSEPESMEYGLFRVTRHGELELLRSACLESLTDVHHKMLHLAEHAKNPRQCRAD
ncbi:hypothetical protein [Iodobacter fluviatilis]|uniref:Uncharacterized protein n=1 Tax=Iodobacter fluviatilis TaxID=537 RepID=A0A377Q1P4_9NEIS|nr:hypothetical protein [Iodobacter fluviatilis]TCU90159.1 hypothetical protein EV682_101179 [Iodobacter fluviatilis]STQ89186.1 Uncharacterised protein [Iodobacter fluviatilis]